MGFYGKINSNAKSSFTFDKVYPTRRMADLYAETDGVFIGRFVLVDYDHGDYADYTTIPNDGDTGIIEAEGSIKRVTVTETIDNLETEVVKYQFYEAGAWGEPKYLTYAELFNADTAVYESQRGYDSTVWQKVTSPITGASLYAMTAELNSVVPTIVLTPDAPSDNTAKHSAYFGSATNDVYYDLHLEVPWKFKLSSVIGNNVYYNKDGFDATTVNYSTDKYPTVTDEFTAKNSSSGLKYYDPNNPQTPAVFNDTKELVANLPGIGDSVAQLWDVMYGGKDLAKRNSKGEYKRNTKVQWDGSYSGLRLLNYDNTKNGYTYSTQNVSTLAGAINSAHDLMGKIIRVYHNENLADLSDARIYYVPFPEENAPVVTPAAGSENCQPGHYYYRYTHYEPDVRQNDPNYPLLDSNSAASELDNIYVETDEDISEYISGSDLTGDLWYQENETDFMYETNGVEESKEYVRIANNLTEIELGPRYKPNKYYYLEANNNGDLYHLDSSAEQNLERTYYNLISTAGERTSYFYTPGQYFYRQKNYTYDGPEQYTPKANKNYYSLVTGTTNYIAAADLQKEGFMCGSGNLPIKSIAETANQDLYEYYIPAVSQILPSGGDSGSEVQGVTSLTRVDYGGIENNIVNFDSTRCYKKVSDGVYQKMLTNPAANDFRTPVPYYEFRTEKIDYFYEADKYYYRDDERNYILNTHDEVNEDGTDYDPNYPDPGTYVLFDPTNSNHVTAVQKIFPENTFYDEDNGSYEPVDAPDENISTYYELKDWYVYEDTNNVYTPGMKWTLSYIPSGVKLSRRKKVYSLVELKGFARDYNSLHGLILKLHDMMGDGADRESFQYISGVPYVERDEDNIRGAIQTMEDKWNTKFGTLTPNSLVVIDSYGRLSAGSTTGDSWIGVSTNGSGVSLTHGAPATTSHTVISDVTPTFGGTFTITDLDFDSKGHKANSGTHTVTIPQGSLSDTTANGADVITQLSFTANTGALSTTRANIGTLLLTGYTAQSGIGSSSVNANQTLNQALAALDNRIDSSASSSSSALSGAINALDATATAQTGYALTEVTEVNGVISKTGEMQIAGVYAPLITPTLSGPYLQSYTNPTTSEVTVPMAADVVYRSGTTPVSTKQIANLDYVNDTVTNAISDLTLTTAVTATSGYALTGITQTNGVISKTSEVELVSAQTISDLEDRIAALEDIIASLTENSSTGIISITVPEEEPVGE